MACPGFVKSTSITNVINSSTLKWSEIIVENDTLSHLQHHGIVMQNSASDEFTAVIVVYFRRLCLFP